LNKFGRWTIEIIKRSEHDVGFHVLPRRWVVERAFAWLGTDVPGSPRTSKPPMPLLLPGSSSLTSERSPAGWQGLEMHRFESGS
jgi:hypothetical protein